MWAAVGAPSIQPIAHRRNVVAYAAVAGAAAASWIKVKCPGRRKTSRNRGEVLFGGE